MKGKINFINCLHPAGLTCPADPGCGTDGRRSCGPAGGRGWGYVSNLPGAAAGDCLEGKPVLPEVESKGCTGLMQVAGRWHQERMKELGADNLKDAHQNMLVAADYLQELVETYGDPVMVLMVYNGDSRAEDYWKGHCGPSDYAEEILELSAQLEVQHGK